MSVDKRIVSCGDKRLSTVRFTAFTYLLSRISARMDLEIIPLIVEFRVFAKVKICLWKCWTKTLFNKLLWKIQLATIKINICKYNDIESDKSPPTFNVYDSKVNIALMTFCLTL